MKEILFRGKRIDNGEWVEGYFVKKIDPLFKTEMCFILIQEYDKSCIDGTPTVLKSEMTWYKVIPETVGQFTCLTDKNGKKIFEGDVVKNKHSDSYVVKHGRHDLSCCGCCFGSHDSIGFYLYSKHNYVLSEENVWDDLEIIGNIHDNPVYLEKE